MTASDLAAELERDLKAKWPQLWTLLKHPEEVADWIADWQEKHGVDADDLEAAAELIGLGLLV